MSTLDSFGPERICHHHAIIVLAVFEVFAEELLAAGGFGSGLLIEVDEAGHEMDVIEGDVPVGKGAAVAA